MSLIKNVTPTNYLEEKEKFFRDPRYNPQFIYPDLNPADELNAFGHPKNEYLEKAKLIVEKAYFGRNEQDILMSEGRLLSQAEVTEKFSSFLRLHDLDRRYQIIWSSSFVSRASINADTIKLKTSAEFRKEGVIGLLYHEIGTHALRRINYEQQPWFKKKQKYGYKDYLRTEEGLAVLHFLLPHSFKSAVSSALRYMAIAYAQQHSFAETWAYLEPYMHNLETRWMVTFRQKRGISDTSLPGGFTKDLVYFEGAIETARWLDANEYNLGPLYFGKLAAEDAQKALNDNPHFKPLLPSFYRIDPNKYAQSIKEIAQYNNFLE